MAAATDPRQLLAANADASDFFRRTLLGPEGSGPRDYLVARGFGVLLEDTRWAVGYAPPGWTRLRDHLASLGYSDAVMHEAGLTFATKAGRLVDVFRGRIMFGVRNPGKCPIGFVGRSSPKASPTTPKYLNTRRTRLYDKCSVLFGLGEAQSQHPATTIVSEGPLDAIAFDLASETSDRAVSLATCGTAFSKAQAAVVAKSRPDDVILAFDSDPAGTRALESAYRLLPSIRRVRAWRPGDSSDPADYLLHFGSSTVRMSVREAGLAADEIVERHFSTWPSTKQGAESDVCLLREVLTSVRAMHANDVARQAARVARRLGITYEQVTSELVHPIGDVSGSRPWSALESQPARRTCSR